MEKWPIGVFANLDAGLGVRLEAAQELGVPTIQLHAPSPATERPSGPASGGNHVNRGGSWYYFAAWCRSASRYSDSNTRHNYFGFRCVREL